WAERRWRLGPWRASTGDAVAAGGGGGGPAQERRPHPQLAGGDTTPRAPPRAAQVAPIAPGLASLAQGASRCFEGGLVTQTAVEMDRGFLFVMSISDGSCLAVLAAANCNVAV